MKIKPNNQANISRIVHGHWRLADWELSSQELLKLTQQCVDMGLTSFDHADIYGDYSCESIFGEALSLKKSLRKDIQIITKCGIALLSEKFPHRKVQHYDYSSQHIISSVEKSLSNFDTDYIDLLLLHRPSPFFEPNEVAKAFSYLKQKGMVLEFGVSNFNPLQYETLQSYLNVKLITNQVEISPLCIDHFENGNIDFFLKERIKPMAWSPLAGGKVFSPKSEKDKKVIDTIQEVMEEMGVNSIDMVIYAWLLKHPAQIIPIIGSGKIERLQAAMEAQELEMSLEQWFKIYIASRGEALP